MHVEKPKKKWIVKRKQLQKKKLRIPARRIVVQKLKKIKKATMAATENAIIQVAQLHFFNLA